MELCFTVPPQLADRPLRVFLRQCGASTALVKGVKYQGDGFFADGVPVHTDYLVRTGQRITFSLPPEPPTTVEPQGDIPVQIAFEDDFAVVLDKPAGLAVHPTLGYPGDTLANAWLGELARRGQTGVFRAVNRIDKNTSGLVLLAQNAFAAPLLAKTAHKKYFAVVEGRLPLGEGEINAPLARRGDSIIGRCVRADGKPSCTRYTVLAASDEFSLVECLPVTGRTHQIRVHFSWLSHPLAGDTLYGGHDNAIGRHALHCGEVSFCHPLTQRLITVKSELPPDMRALVEKIPTRGNMKPL